MTARTLVLKPLFYINATVSVSSNWEGGQQNSRNTNNENWLSLFRNWSIFLSWWQNLSLVYTVGAEIRYNCNTCCLCRDAVWIWQQRTENRDSLQVNCSVTQETSNIGYQKISPSLHLSYPSMFLSMIVSLIVDWPCKIKSGLQNSHNYHSGHQKGYSFSFGVC